MVGVELGLGLGWGWIGVGLGMGWGWLGWLGLVGVGWVGVGSKKQIQNPFPGRPDSRPDSRPDGRRSTLTIIPSTVFLYLDRVWQYNFLRTIMSEK